MMFLEKLKRLHGEAAEAPWFAEDVNDDGTIRIDDGRQGGLWPINAEVFEAELIVLLRNKAEAIIALVEAAQKIVDNAALICDEEIELEAALSRLNAEES